jgi:hypothetical protein
MHEAQRKDLSKTTTDIFRMYCGATPGLPKSQTSREDQAQTLARYEHLDRRPSFSNATHDTKATANCNSRRIVELFDHSIEMRQYTSFVCVPSDPFCYHQNFLFLTIRDIARTI